MDSNDDIGSRNTKNSNLSASQTVAPRTSHLQAKAR